MPAAYSIWGSEQRPPALALWCRDTRRQCARGLRAQQYHQLRAEPSMNANKLCAATGINHDACGGAGLSNYEGPRRRSPLLQLRFLRCAVAYQDNYGQLLTPSISSGFIFFGEQHEGLMAMMHSYRAYFLSASDHIRSVTAIQTTDDASATAEAEYLLNCSD